LLVIYLFSIISYLTSINWGLGIGDLGMKKKIKNKKKKNRKIKKI